MSECARRLSVVGYEVEVLGGEAREASATGGGVGCIVVAVQRCAVRFVEGAKRRLERGVLALRLRPMHSPEFELVVMHGEHCPRARLKQLKAVRTQVWHGLLVSDLNTVACVRQRVSWTALSRLPLPCTWFRRWIGLKCDHGQCNRGSGQGVGAVLQPAEGEVHAVPRSGSNLFTRFVRGQGWDEPDWTGQLDWAVEIGRERERWQELGAWVAVEWVMHQSMRISVAMWRYGWLGLVVLWWTIPGRDLQGPVFRREERRGASSM